MKTLDEIMLLTDEKIQEIQRMFTRFPGDITDIDEGRALVKEALDVFLSIPINVVCPECEGNGFVEGIFTLSDICPKCRGTGKLPDITVRDAIKKVRGDG